MKFLIFFFFTFKFLLAFEEPTTCSPCIAFFDDVKKLNEEGVDTADKIRNICYDITLGSQFFNVICKRYMVRNFYSRRREIEALKDSKEICREIYFC
uniref:Saposin B-type domain-containing protein n=1 Tax=Strongyloides papillosus TaxID=174720 RepID=A0A0N5CA95_STREA